MITANFGYSNNRPISVEVSGHADFAQYGNDIVCAAVTSALQLTANGITEIVGDSAKIVQKENLIKVTLAPNPKESSVSFLKALRLHLATLAEDYPTNIEVSITEV